MCLRVLHLQVILISFLGLMLECWLLEDTASGGYFDFLSESDVRLSWLLEGTAFAGHFDFFSWSDVGVLVA